MDSVTQIALGAAVGEKVLGKKVGNKAPLWGAALGILPDLDVLGAAFLSGTDQLGFHRWISHSLLFAVGGGLGIGWALSKLHRGANWREWSALAFWAILTHALLDCFTGYGTQLFSPFSNYPVAFGSIFVIDPLYTLPLAIG
ncbi:MAG: metal-dependent hydrolase, partial [Gemmatimonadota bacterium]|nr:metal-dependent hydrolase [Gemmatimonadota bacterium]